METAQEDRTADVTPSWAEHIARCLDAGLSSSDLWGPDTNNRGNVYDLDYAFTVPFNLTELEDRVRKESKETKRKRVRELIINAYSRLDEVAPAPFPSCPELSLAGWHVVNFLSTFSFRVATANCPVYCGVLLQQRTFHYLFDCHDEEGKNKISLLFSRLKKGGYVRAITGPLAHRGSLWQPNPFLENPYPFPPLRFNGGDNA